MMNKNVGKVDRISRTVIAVSLFVIGLLAGVGTGLKVLILLFAAIALFTAIFGT